MEQVSIFHVISLLILTLMCPLFAFVCRSDLGIPDPRAGRLRLQSPLFTVRWRPHSGPPAFWRSTQLLLTVVESAAVAHQASLALPERHHLLHGWGWPLCNSLRPAVRLRILVCALLSM
eukprot:2429629-Rhodomonas_salina.1